MNAKPIRWNAEKNVELMRERLISFEEVLSCVEHGGLLAVLDHPHRLRYANQRIWVVRVRGYAYLVPLVESQSEIFLKTIMPSRKATRQYLSESDDDN